MKCVTKFCLFFFFFFCRQRLNLLYFNKTTEDIWCKSKFDALESEDDRFLARYILSNSGDEWKGETGHMSAKFAQDVHDAESNSHSTFCFVCGPTGFIDSCHSELQSIGFDTNNLHVFR